ncbi:MAG: hypothetical protein KQA33_02260 [Candidatus Aenigmarchaeota archaeon]|nr:hypothetical protein [Candidatus Aenigmarchaeota archaeon]
MTNEEEQSKQLQRDIRSELCKLEKNIQAITRKYKEGSELPDFKKDCCSEEITKYVEEAGKMIKLLNLNNNKGYIRDAERILPKLRDYNMRLMEKYKLEAI